MHHERQPLERRRHPRREVQSPGTAFLLCRSSVMAVPVRTKNISEGGVLIVAEEELRGDRMLLQLSLPKFDGMLVECDVRHQSCFEQELITGKSRRLYAYGLEFGRVLQMSDVHETLLAAFPKSIDHRGRPARASRTPRDDSTSESLVPFLSALGLAVVYASQFPWG